MPKSKRRGKGNRADKEKPLLTVQGVLRLEKSFITAQHEDAQTIVIRRSDDAPAEEIKLVPGQSEHDLVKYKAGYDVGPSNPNPQTEPEAEIIRERRKVEVREEAFEEMKRQSEMERQDRERRFKRSVGLLPDIPPGTEDDEQTTAAAGAAGQAATVSAAAAAIPVAHFNPDDPSSYVLPESLSREPAFHNDLPLEFGSKALLPLADSDPPAPPQQQRLEPVSVTSQLEADGEGSELQRFPEDMLPKMKPLPEASATAGETQVNMSSMALSVAMAMEDKRKREARERIAKGEEQEEDHDEMIYSLDEITRMNEQSAEVQGPELTEQHIQEVVKQQQSDQNSKDVLDTYWQFVRENPQDFNGWCYLIQHVENVNVLDEVRSAYNAFLPLFPYCYAYWNRYSDIEKKHDNWQRALAILHRGLEAIPLSVDLWISYLELYHKMYENHDDFDDLFRTQCERAIQTVGLEYRSDPLWESYIEWEQEKKNLKWITGIYKRVIAIPTRLYNKHWDNFIAHIRDHHPRDILEYEEYEELRKATCLELELTYRPDPVIEPVKPREVVQPEDKLKAGMKERIVASVVAVHERCEEEVDRRYRFEEKVKRPYFHVKPMDLKQLKNWEAYLDFEIGCGNHERIVVLFERCLIPCAHYEQFWAKYARYLECYHKSELTRQDGDSLPAAGESESPLKKARWAFGTGLTKVDEMREKRCTWSLRGWKEKDKDGKEVMMAEEVTVKDKVPSPTIDEEQSASKEADKESSGVELPGAEADSEEGDTENIADNNQLDAAAAQPKSSSEFHQETIDDEMIAVPKTTTDAKGQESVRDVYKRACIVHCPKKAMIKLRWAAFEEETGDVAKAKEILVSLNRQYPLLLECCMQLIDIERRCDNLDKAEEYYKKLIKRVPKNRTSIRTWVSMKFARFQFKVCGQSDRALATLRDALKRERGDPRLYTQIIDVCYQRHPVDVVGVTAAIELAIKSQELTNMKKLDFVKRKVEFMQEFGDVARYRDAVDQIKTFRQLCTSDLKLEAKRRKELEREEHKLKELETLKAQVRADANIKAKVAEAEGRLMCTNCRADMFPDERGVYEFERFRGGRGGAPRRNAAEEQEVAEADEDGVVDLMELEIPEDQEEQIKKTLEEKTKYKEVAPTWELNMESYGYSKRRRVYDPDYEHVETAKFKEYERLEGSGYEGALKDGDNERPRNINAPGLGSLQGDSSRSTEPKKNYTTSDYIVPPKVPQLQMGPGIGPIKPKSSAPGLEPDLTVFELPPEIANPQKSPCVNVPEWFVKEGGELCLSDTANGVSVLRYWPKFLSEKGNHLMFNRLRKYCKWHQKQVKIGGEWKYETRLVAWYGPCDYNYSGLNLEKNLNWAPELLDLLHRLIAMTHHEFNSCFLNLYRHGHDMCGWHADVHPQLGRNPAVASISLGAVRVFEFRKKSGPPNFIRFPLFPGSLLVMEGATQEDWLHCLPRDVNCKEERINLTFRSMFSIDKRN